jgi:hypothetical protein
MATSRRRFLKTGTMVAVSAGLTACLGNDALAEITNISTPKSRLNFSKTEFEDCLNSNFRFRSGAETVTMKLSKIADLKRPLGKQARTSGQAFSLTFEGPAGVGQETYAVEHQRMGRFSLLVVPVVSKKNPGRRYEAIINRL